MDFLDFGDRPPPHGAKAQVRKQASRLLEFPRLWTGLFIYRRPSSNPTTFEYSTPYRVNHQYENGDNYVDSKLENKNRSVKSEDLLIGRLWPGGFSIAPQSFFPLLCARE